jgi:hypothetical protein
LTCDADAMESDSMAECSDAQVRITPDEPKPVTFCV